jgi:CRISPR-associated endonuclease/helicase Cas3
VPGPRLLLLAPDPTADPPATWLGADLRRTGFVYPDHALLWRSARILMQTGCIETPEGVRALVEAAYDDEAPSAIPPALAPSANRAEGNELAAAGIASQNLLEIDRPYERDAGLWEPDVRTPTRLADARIAFRLARIEDGRAVPWYPHNDARRAWALSEVAVRANRLASAVEDARIAAAKQDWIRWDREIPVLLLQHDASGRWRGQGIDLKEKRQPVTYDTSRGLIIGS